ncbi:MAG TPA: anthranilate synthase component I family protein [Flavobacteriales bacterium]|nr:anthranilate synthase component I family protein [Flavobacteriales bacterium]HIO73672.1 anthranilate synthase component I family protein [Flavobacteriales bacterium]
MRCQEFYADNFNLNPFHLFQRLNDISETPFSSYYRLNDKYLICGSPERFMKKTGDRIISQPIKGTIKRGETQAEDLVLKQELAQSAKDMNENVMIVDIVRNDLSRTAARNSVHVSELFGIYTFKHVHQMISTVESELADDCHFIDAIREAFPMGSMTGAPKIKAMELIEQFEYTKRGLYSGAAGYITPSGDFDFNVVIRSLLYNSTSEYLSFIVGGAITDNSIAEDEYEECLLKAIPMFKALNLNLKDVNLLAQ